jgi:hypothetical protein
VEVAACCVEKTIALLCIEIIYGGNVGAVGFLVFCYGYEALF